MIDAVVWARHCLFLEAVAVVRLSAIIIFNVNLPFCPLPALLS